MHTTASAWCPVGQTAFNGHPLICPTCGLVLAGRAPPPFQVGHVLAGGRYTVRRALSRGGMGALYLATDHATFDRPVALKVLLDYSRSPRSLTSGLPSRCAPASA
jgi:hypothetical protein